MQRRLPRGGSKELALLADSMNRMAAELDQRIHRILNQQNEHEAMLSSMEEGVLAVDNHGAILSLNETCAALLGADAAKLRGRIIYEVIRKPDLLSFVEAALADNASLDGDLRFYGPEERWLNAHGTVLHDANRRKIGALIVLHDVTRLRRLENVRRDFVANVSHELRTPITSIKGFVETLLDEALENKENSLRFLQIVHRQVNRLDAIICDLLTLSRIERGSEEQTIEAEPEPVAGGAAGGGRDVPAAGRREGDRLGPAMPGRLDRGDQRPLVGAGGGESRGQRDQVQRTRGERRRGRRPRRRRGGHPRQGRGLRHRREALAAAVRAVLPR